MAKNKSKLGVYPTPSTQNWQAQEDARTLATASAISKDPKRLKAAVSEAKKMASEKTEEVKAMKQVASKKVK